MVSEKEKDRFEEICDFFREYSTIKEEIEMTNEMLQIYNGLRKQIVNQMDSIDKLLRKVEKLEELHRMVMNALKSLKEDYEKLGKENSELHVKTDFLDTEKEAFRKENEQLKAEILLQNQVIENFHHDDDDDEQEEEIIDI